MLDNHVAYTATSPHSGDHLSRVRESMKGKVNHSTEIIDGHDINKSTTSIKK